MRRVEAIEDDRDAAPSGVRREEQGTEMITRLVFSVGLIAVLFCFWLIMTKPMCRDGLAASLGARLEWTCVAERG